MGYTICVLNPFGVGYMDETAIEVSSRYVAPDTDVSCRSLGDAAPPYPWPVASSCRAAVDAARTAEADGIDALVIGCAADPFLSEIRTAVEIPVIGVTETACIGVGEHGRLAILTRVLSPEYQRHIPAQGTKSAWEKRAQDYGVPPERLSIGHVDVLEHPGLAELEHLTRTDPALLRARTVDAMTASLHSGGLGAARDAISEGATSVLFGCVFWSPGLSETSTGEPERSWVGRILNPLGDAVQRAETILGG